MWTSKALAIKAYNECVKINTHKFFKKEGYVLVLKEYKLVEQKDIV